MLKACVHLWDPNNVYKSTQHDCHHDTKVKPEAATAAIELLMMGGKTPEKCWAVNKRQDNKLENCCIWLVIWTWSEWSCDLTLFSLRLSTPWILLPCPYTLLGLGTHSVTWIGLLPLTLQIWITQCFSDQATYMTGFVVPFPAGSRYFYHSKATRPAPGHTQFPETGRGGCNFPGGKILQAWSWQIISNAKLTNAWSHASTSPMISLCDV